jgi:hypothetical protein
MPEKKYTESEQKFIRENYLKMPTKTMCRKLGCSEVRINRYMRLNGLIIPEELKLKRIKDSQFKKGRISANKGKKLHEYMSSESIERIKATQFKKGNLPQNTRRDGDISRRRDRTGKIYFYIRLALGEWVMLHRYNWEKVHGKIPEGYVLQFIDGDSENTEVENLRLVSRIELILKNSKYEIPEEVIPSMVAARQLEIKIKELENG